MPSRYLQLALLAVIAVHSLALEQPSDALETHSLGDSAGEFYAVAGGGTYMTPIRNLAPAPCNTTAYVTGKRVEGYAPSSVMPKGLTVLRYAQTNKNECSAACDEGARCQRHPPHS